MEGHKKITVWVRDNKKCIYCNKPVHFSDMKVDHITLKAKGGTDAYTNLASCCGDCNTLKADMTVEQFVILINNLIDMLRADIKFKALLRHYSVKVKKLSDFMPRIRAIQDSCYGATEKTLNYK